MSQTVPLESQGGFLDFLVPPELIRDGKNELNVYLVNGTPRAPKLSPVVSIANFKG